VSAHRRATAIKVDFGMLGEGLFMWPCRSTKLRLGRTGLFESSERSAEDGDGERPRRLRLRSPEPVSYDDRAGNDSP
jgi:hypothetical protein